MESEVSEAGSYANGTYLSENASFESTGADRNKAFLRRNAGVSDSFLPALEPENDSLDLK